MGGMLGREGTIAQIHTDRERFMYVFLERRSAPSDACLRYAE